MTVPVCTGGRDGGLIAPHLAYGVAAAWVLDHLR